MGKYNIKVILNDHIIGQVFIKRNVVRINQPVFLQQHPFSSNIWLEKEKKKEWTLHFEIILHDHVGGSIVS